MGRLDVDRLRRDGWVAIPGLLSPGQAASLAQDCLLVLSEADDVRPGDKRVSGTTHAADLLLRMPELAALLASPEVADAVVALLGAGAAVAAAQSAQFRCPQPGYGEQSLHADDLPIGHADESRGVTGIVALCDFTADNGSTAVVPGSHRRPDLQRRVGKLDLGRDEVILSGPAGTAFVFSAHLLHRGTRNRSPRPRPALQVHWRRHRSPFPNSSGRQ